MATTSAAVYQAPQALEELGNALDFIENNQLVFMLREIEFRLGQLGAIRRRFQIEIDRGAFLRHGQRQCGLAHLAWSKQRNCRRFGQRSPKIFQLVTDYHPCNYGYLFHKCKVIGSELLELFKNLSQKRL